MIAFGFTSNLRSQLSGGRRGLIVLLAAGLPWSAAASISASLSWTPSPDTNVASYTLFYGGGCRQYTNSVNVGNVTNAVIPGLIENTTYFFAAKARNSAGDESDFSNEAAFAAFRTTPDSMLRLKALPNGNSSNSFRFTLDASAPPGAVINATSGVVCWTPGRANASTTNYLNIVVTDTKNPARRISETLMIIVGDYLETRLGSIAVPAGQTGSLPVSVAASSSVTNLQFSLNWAGDKLLTPTLTWFPPVVSGSLQFQNGQLIVSLQTTADQPMTGTNQVAQVNFLAGSCPSSKIVPVAASNCTGKTANGSTYDNTVALSGEVIIVGADPLLRPQADTGHGRALSLYAPVGNYQLQYTTSLVPPVNWMPLLNYQQASVAQTVALDSTEPVIFYRLKQL